MKRSERKLKISALVIKTANLVYTRRDSLDINLIVDQQISVSDVCGGENCSGRCPRRSQHFTTSCQ